MNKEISKKEDLLDFLRIHKNYLEEHFGVTKIALFGSYARGEQKQTSDIDILVELKKEFKTYENHYNLNIFLEKSFNKKVDLGYFESVRLFIMRFIKEELIYA